MEDIFIQALITRSYNETDLLDKLPEDIKLMVDDKLSESNEAMQVETEEIVPEKISKLQLKIQLVKMGVDLKIIENAINALPEPQKTFASLSWTEATSFYRDNDMIASVGQMLNLTSEQIDELFIEANKIRL